MARALTPGAAPVAPLRPPPQPPQPFVGRERERTSLARRLEDRGVAAITGVVGVGKTALLADYAASADRPTEWVEIYRGLSDTGEALFWQIARPLADLSSQTWRALHRMAQSTPPYPLAARLQVALAAYGQLRHAPLLVIDGIEHLEQPEASALVAALCDYVASGRAGDVQLAVIGRTLPYRLHPYTLPPLAGISAAAAQAWAQHLGLPLDDTMAAALITATGGVPMALSDALTAQIAGAAPPAETERRLWALLAGLAPSARDLLVALAHGNAPPALSLEQRADLAQLTDRHLIHHNAASELLVHPMIRAFIG